MSRPRKDGQRAVGIQSKKGKLYIVISKTVVEDGQKKSKREWTATGLNDTPENVRKASEARARLMSRKISVTIDRNILISEYIELFLSRKKRVVADTTYAAYTDRAKPITSFFAEIRLRDINEIMLENFLDSLFEQKHLSERRVKDIKVLLCGILEEAVKEGILTYNPAKEIVINKSLAAKYSKERNTDEEFFSYDEAQLFLSETENHELYELFYTTLFFGLRREEILSLRWNAVNFKEKTLTISHTVTKGTTINRINSTKTAASNRQYPLSDDQIAMFNKLQAKEKAYRKLFGNSYYDTDYIFKHQDGTLFYPDYPTKAFKKVLKRITELPQGITFHGLRNSCVSILVHQGLDVKSIQKWVGHAELDTTLRIYAKVKDKEAKKEISDAMKELIPLAKD